LASPPLHFDSDQAIEVGVHGLVDDTHAAFTELFENLVMRDGAPDHAWLHLQQGERTQF
jgi:hypothetical protein